MREYFGALVFDPAVGLARPVRRCMLEEPHYFFVVIGGRRDKVVAGILGIRPKDRGRSG